MKKNIEWYPHRKDSHRHPKFKFLRTLYGGGTLGWAMEARFWALNNLIADSEECKLDLSKRRNLGVIADEIDLPLDELESFIDRLVSPDIELLFICEPGIYTTKKVTEALQITLSEREKSRLRKGKSKNSEGKDESSPELPKSTPEFLHTVKDSKVKEKKEEDSKVNTETDLTFTENNSSSLTLTTKSYIYTPQNFDDPEDIKARITLMAARFCKIQTLTEAEKSRFYNIITSTKGCSLKTAHRITLECFQNWKNLKEEKQNLPYLSIMIEGKIQDAIKSFAKSKEKNECNALLGKNNGNSKSINELAEALKVD